MVLAPGPGASVFDSSPARAVGQELLAMTPGTDQFAERLRAIMGELDANQVKLDRALDETDKRLARSHSRRPSSGRNDAG
jgi:hypothetical protein